MTDHPDPHFREGLAQGEIRLQKCRSCDTVFFFPRVLCPACYAEDPGWITASGDAEVYTFTTVRQRPERGGDYNVSMIALAEGARMMSTVDGDPDRVRIGMKVRAYVGEVDGAPAVLCRPAEG